MEIAKNILFWKIRASFVGAHHFGIHKVISTFCEPRYTAMEIANVVSVDGPFLWAIAHPFWSPGADFNVWEPQYTVMGRPPKLVVSIDSRPFYGLAHCFKCLEVISRSGYPTRSYGEVAKTHCFRRFKPVSWASSPFWVPGQLPRSGNHFTWLYGSRQHSFPLIWTHFVDYKLTRLGSRQDFHDSGES